MKVLFYITKALLSFSLVFLVGIGLQLVFTWGGKSFEYYSFIEWVMQVLWIMLLTGLSLVFIVPEKYNNKEI